MTSAKLLQKGLYRRLDKLTDEIEDFLLKPIVFPTAINLKESLVDYWQKNRRVSGRNYFKFRRRVRSNFIF